MVRTLGTLVRVQTSEKTGKTYALFLCGVLQFDAFIDVEYINKSIVLEEGSKYLIDIVPFYSDSQDKSFIGYRVLGKYYG